MWTGNIFMKLDAIKEVKVSSDSAAYCTHLQLEIDYILFVIKLVYHKTLRLQQYLKGFIITYELPQKVIEAIITRK